MLARYEPTDNLLIVAESQRGLAEAHTSTGSFNAAVDWFTQAIDCFHKLTRNHEEARTRLKLVHVHLEMGNIDKALHEAQQAEKTFLEIGVQHDADRARREIEMILRAV